MGNSCRSCCEEMDDYEREILIKFGLANPQFQSISDSSINMLNNEDKIIDILTEESITEIFKAFYTNLEESKKIKELKKNLIFNNKLSFLKNNFKFWARFDDQENNSNKIHNYFFEIECPFTPELVFLYLANLNEKKEKKLSNQISISEKLYQIESENDILIINKMRTKKNLANSPRDIFKLSVFKKIAEKKFELAELSCQFTELYKLEDIRKINNELKDEALIFMSGFKFEKQERGWILSHSRKIDPLSPFGLILAKGFLKKIMKSFFNNLFLNLSEFIILRKKMKNWDNLVWFDNSKNNIKNVVEENFEILNSLNFNLKCLSKEAQDVFEKKSALGSDILYSSDDEILKESKNKFIDNRSFENNYENFRESEKIQKSDSFQNNSDNQREKSNQKLYSFNKIEKEHFLDGDREDQFLSFNNKNDLEIFLNPKKEKEKEKFQLDILLEENENSENKISKNLSLSSEKKEENEIENSINNFENTHIVVGDLIKMESDLNESEVDIQKIEELVKNEDQKIENNDSSMESFENNKKIGQFVKNENTNNDLSMESSENNNKIGHFVKNENTNNDLSMESFENNNKIGDKKIEIDELSMESFENKNKIGENNTEKEIGENNTEKEIGENNEEIGVEEIAKKSLDEIEERNRNLENEKNFNFNNKLEDVIEEEDIEEEDIEEEEDIQEVDIQEEDIQEEDIQEEDIEEEEDIQEEDIQEEDIKEEDIQEEDIQEDIGKNSEKDFEKEVINEESGLEKEVLKVVDSMREKTFDTFKENAERAVLKEEKIIKINNESKLMEFLNKNTENDLKTNNLLNNVNKQNNSQINDHNKINKEIQEKYEKKSLEFSENEEKNLNEKNSEQLLENEEKKSNENNSQQPSENEEERTNKITDEEKLKLFLDNGDKNSLEEVEIENLKISREITMSDFEDNMDDHEKMEYSENEDCLIGNSENNSKNCLKEFFAEKDLKGNIKILENERNKSKEDFVKISDDSLNSPLNKLIKE